MSKNNAVWFGYGSLGMDTVCNLLVDLRRQRIQQRWDARLLQRLNRNTAPAKGSPRRPGRL